MSNQPARPWATRACGSGRAIRLCAGGSCRRARPPAPRDHQRDSQARQALLRLQCPHGSPLIGEAAWSASGEGERLWFVGTLATIRVPGEAVGGRYALIEFLFPKHASPPRHTHPQDESYIVIEGHLTVHAGGHRFDLETGGAATVPMGVPHTFRVDSETARVLVLSTPAGLERFVRDGGFPATAPTLPPADAPRRSAEELAQIFQAHGQLNVGPPLTPDD